MNCIEGVEQDVKNSAFYYSTLQDVEQEKKRDFLNGSAGFILKVGFDLVAFFLLGIIDISNAVYVFCINICLSN